MKPLALATNIFGLSMLKSALLSPTPSPMGGALPETHPMFGKEPTAAPAPPPRVPGLADNENPETIQGRTGAPQPMPGSASGAVMPQPLPTPSVPGLSDNENPETIQGHIANLDAAYNKARLSVPGLADNENPETIQGRTGAPQPMPGSASGAVMPPAAMAAAPAPVAAAPAGPMRPSTPAPTQFTAAQIAQFNQGLRGNSRFNPRSSADLRNMQRMISGGNRATLTSRQDRALQRAPMVDGVPGINKIASSPLGLALDIFSFHDFMKNAVGSNFDPLAAAAHGSMTPAGQFNPAAAAAHGSMNPQGSAAGPGVLPTGGGGGRGPRVPKIDPNEELFMKEFGNKFNRMKLPAGQPGMWQRLMSGLGKGGGGRGKLLTGIGMAGAGLLGNMWGGHGKQQAVEQASRGGLGQGLQFAQQQYQHRGFLDRIMNNDPDSISKLLAMLQGGGGQA